jgi:hypothetical protein
MPSLRRDISPQTPLDICRACQRCRIDGLQRAGTVRHMRRSPGTGDLHELEVGGLEAGDLGLVER